MDYTTILAKTYGVYLFFVGLSLFLSPGRYRDWYSNIISEDRRQLFGGMFALLIGSFIISIHNHWVADWRVIITLIGYWGVFWGAGLFLSKDFGQLFKIMINSSDTVYRLSGIFWAALGGFLFYQGYMI